MAGQVVPVKINAEKEGVEAAKKYKVGGFPTILFLAPTGNVSSKIGGYMPPGPFAEAMSKAVQAYKDLPGLEAKMKSEPDNMEVAAKLAGIYAVQGKRERAEELLERAAKDPDKAGENLAKAYNAVGDSYQEEGAFDKAIPLFEKAVAVSKKPFDTAYANISMAVCYLAQEKFKEAIPALEATIAVPDGPKDLKEQAEQYLKIAKEKAK